MTTIALKGQRVSVVYNDALHYGTVVEKSHALKGTTRVKWDDESYLPDGLYATNLLTKGGKNGTRLSENA